MAMITMRKLRAIMPADEKRRLLKAFTSLGCVEIKTADAAQELEQAGLLASVTPDAQAIQHKNDLMQALATLQRYAPGKKPFLEPKPRLTEQELYEKASIKKADELAAEILAINKQLNHLHANQSQLEAKIAYLAPWTPSDLPLELAGGKYHTIERATCPATTDISALLKSRPAELELAEIELVNQDGEQQYLLFVYHNQAAEQIQELFKQYGLTRISFKDEVGTAQACLDAAQAELQEAAAAEATQIARLNELKGQRAFLEQALDAQDLEVVRETTSKAMRATRATIYFEAWLPDYQEDAVTAVLQEHGCAYEFAAVEEGDDPPVLLENHKYFRPFSAITELYGMPAYGSIVDPNPFVAVFFFIFFGMMLGDAMYGLLMAGATFYVLRKMQPQGGFKNYMIVACAVGVSSVIFGALFSSWFGDFPTALGNMLGFNWAIPPLLFDPLDDPIPMLVIALGIGVVNLFIGMGLAAYRMIKQGHLMDAICDIFLWYLIVGGLLYALVPFLTESSNAMPGLYVAGVGAAGVLIFGGRHKTGFGKITGGLSSLYGITSYLSDILSYSRLMALGLASGVVAQVVNTMSGLAGNGVVGWLLFIVVFIAGQTFNLAIGLLGAFVHSCRLIYVEFFGKFFEAGGRPFEPLANKTKYTQVIKEDN